MGDELALCDEWDAALARLRRCAAADLPHIAQVFPIPAGVFTENLVGLASVIVDGEQYQPDESGVPAFITPVFHAFSYPLRAEPPAPDPPRNRPLIEPSPLRLEGWSERLIDLVAWHPASPERWATRCGIADRLGEPHWENCRIWRTVFNWLRAGADGIVPLHPSALHWLDAETLIAEDNEHRRTLIRALMTPRDLPRIVAA